MIICVLKWGLTYILLTASEDRWQQLCLKALCHRPSPSWHHPPSLVHNPKQSRDASDEIKNLKWCQWLMSIHKSLYILSCQENPIITFSIWGYWQWIWIGISTFIELDFFFWLPVWHLLNCLYMSNSVKTQNSVLQRILCLRLNEFQSDFLKLFIRV